MPGCCAPALSFLRVYELRGWLRRQAQGADGVGRELDGEGCGVEGDLDELLVRVGVAQEEDGGAVGVAEAEGVVAGAGGGKEGGAALDEVGEVLEQVEVVRVAEGAGLGVDDDEGVFVTSPRC